jgi:hypothetical protein
MLNSFPTKAARPVKPDMVAAGLRAFFNIAKLWDLNNDQAMVLLGQPSKATFHKWKRGDVSGSARQFDLATRLSLVVGIFKALEMLYQRPELADRWVTSSNLAFGGESALDRMMAGQITDLAYVRDYLDSVRGGW